MDSKIIPLQSMESYSLQKELLQIEKNLQAPISPSRCARVIHHLEKQASSLCALKANTQKSMPSQQNIVTELEEKIISLFGRAVGKKVEYQVSQIDKKTQKLLRCISDGEAKEVKRQVKILDVEVKSLLSDHCISKEQLQVISKAKKTIKQATQTLLPSKEKNIVATSFVSHPSFSEKLQEHSDLFSLEEIEELFDVCREIFTQKSQTPPLSYLQLNDSMQKKIKSRCKDLGEDLFCSPLVTAQAIMSVAFELSGCGEHIFSEDELTKFISEASLFEKENESSISLKREDSLPLFLLRP